MYQMEFQISAGGTFTMDKVSWFVIALPVVTILCLIVKSASKNWKGRNIKEEKDGKETE